MEKRQVLQKLNRIVPAFMLLPVCSCFLWNMIIYDGTRLVTTRMTHYDLTLEIDRMMPVIPAFVLVYFGCFLFWGIYYVLAARTSWEDCIRFVTFDLITRTVVGIFFLLLPTTNVRPEITGTDWISHTLRWLYQIDAADNLFPSIHCLVSWNCFVGVRHLKQYGKGCKIIACAMAVLVFLSTLFTKQHVLVDVISAVALSEGVWFLVSHGTFYRRVGKFFDAVNKKLFGRWYKQLIQGSVDI